MRELPLQAFAAAVGRALEVKVDFVLLAGDFFDNSMPAVDVLRFAVEQLMRLKLAGVRVYAIAGSHDYSPTGKTMLSVLEAAGLLYNVHMKWAEDPSGARVFGVEGLRGGLDKEHFAKLADANSSPAAQARYNIFMFHSAVDEMCGMAGVKLAALPKGFDYYAAGHVHKPAQQMHGNGTIVFPGPLFPSEFSELEQLGCGSFCIVDASKGAPVVETEVIRLADIRMVSISCDGKSPQQIESEFLEELGRADVSGAIVLLKASGTLAAGKPTDISWSRISDAAQRSGARAVKRSVHVTTKEAEVVKVEATGGLEEIEQTVIAKNVENVGERDVIMRLMSALAVEKGEDEKNAVYDDKIRSGAMKVFRVI